MSSLVDSEASETSGLSGDEQDDSVHQDKSRRRPKVAPDSSDSEEEEVDLANEEEICRKEGAGWIVDEEEEDGGGSGASDEDSEDAEGHDRREEVDDEDDDALDDEDYQLIQENIGINLKRKVIFVRRGHFGISLSFPSRLHQFLLLNITLTFARVPNISVNRGVNMPTYQLT